MPFRYGGHAADGGTFTIVRFPETNLHDVVYMEYLTGEHFVDMPEDVDHPSAVMARLSGAGAPPDRTTEILADMLREILESRHVSTNRGMGVRCGRAPGWRIHTVRLPVPISVYRATRRAMTAATHQLPPPRRWRDVTGRLVPADRSVGHPPVLIAETGCISRTAHRMGASRRPRPRSPLPRSCRFSRRIAMGWSRQVIGGEGSCCRLGLLRIGRTDTISPADPGPGWNPGQHSPARG
jgi:Domain of unknown function (DUF5753)